MAWTISRPGGDTLLTTATVFGEDVLDRIYLPGSSTVVANFDVRGFEWYAGDVASLSGGVGVDTLIGSANSDMVVWDIGTVQGFPFDPGFLGRARLPVGAARLEVIALADGDDLLNLTVNPATLSGGPSPGAYAFDVTAYGGDGNDAIASGEGNDLLVGDENAGLPPTDMRFDTIWGFGGNDTIFGDDGSTAPDAGGLADMLSGGMGDDLIYGEGGRDRIEGNEGRDTLYGGGGNDLIDGEDAFADDDLPDSSDTIYGGAGNDDIEGGAGDDLIYGDDDGDFLSGSAGNDTLDGGAGDDVLEAGDGDDTLIGGAGVDELYGGAGADVLYLFADTVTVGDGARDYVQGWDGASALVKFELDGLEVNWSFDAFDGEDGGVDTLVGTSGNDIVLANPDDIYVDSFAQDSRPGRLAGIELVMLGGGADIFLANDPDGATGSGLVYQEAITVFGGEGSDTIVTGSGNDVIRGSGGGADPMASGDDYLVGGAGNDSIGGGPGNDRIYGGAGNDTVSAGLGDDTIFGGGGIDRLSGGGGDDLIFGGRDAFGDDGADIIVLSFAAPLGASTVEGGANDAASDGADDVFVSGAYDTINASLGADDDRYIASSTDSGTLQIDRVDGQLGDDLVSTWYGNDELSGSEGEDALWGGAGSDTIYGGPDTDYLYGGFGDNDVLAGGAGQDFYYWSRTDGQGDQIFDDFRSADPLPGQQADNVLVVFPDFDPTEVDGDGLRTGSGVVEVDRDLYDLSGGDDMVRLTDIDGAAGSMYRLTVLTGDGAANYVEFDQRDVQTILLWNNDAAGTGQVIQTYAWDPIDGRYEYVG